MHMNTHAQRPLGPVQRFAKRSPRRSLLILHLEWCENCPIAYSALHLSLPQWIAPKQSELFIYHQMVFPNSNKVQELRSETSRRSRCKQGLRMVNVAFLGTQRRSHMCRHTHAHTTG